MSEDFRDAGGRAERGLDCFAAVELIEDVLVLLPLSCCSETVSKLETRRFEPGLDMDDEEAWFEMGGLMTCDAPLRYERWKSNLVGEGDRVAIAAKPPGLAGPFSEAMTDVVLRGVVAPARKTYGESVPFGCCGLLGP